MFMYCHNVLSQSRVRKQFFRAMLTFLMFGFWHIGNNYSFSHPSGISDVLQSASWTQFFHKLGKGLPYLIRVKKLRINTSLGVVNCT